MSQDQQEWRPYKDKDETDPRGLEPHEPGAKLDSGKIRAGILSDFRHALMAVAKVCDHGCRKYTRDGWMQVPDAKRRYHDAMWRHLLAGGGDDKDSGLPHLYHVVWNAMAQIEMMERGDHGDC